MLAGVEGGGLGGYVCDVQCKVATFQGKEGENSVRLALGSFDLLPEAVGK